jgi:uncharacterized protein YegP (UPF0339 family)
VINNRFHFRLRNSNRTITENIDLKNIYSKQKSNLKNINSRKKNTYENQTIYTVDFAIKKNIVYEKQIKKFFDINN